MDRDDDIIMISPTEEMDEGVSKMDRQDHYDEIVADNPNMLCSVPEEYQSKSMIVFSVLKNPDNVRYIKSSEAIAEIYREIVENANSCHFLEYSPKHHLTRDVLVQFLNMNRIESLKYFEHWQSLLSQEEVQRLIDMSPDTIQFLSRAPLDLWGYIVRNYLYKLSIESLLLCPDREEVLSAFSSEDARYFIEKTKPFDVLWNVRWRGMHSISRTWLALFEREFIRDQNQCICCAAISNLFILPKHKWCKCR
jgi:hypothetical protein